jgi:hypothetical protein
MLDRPKYCLFDVLTFFQPRPHQLRFVNSRNRKVFTVAFGMKGVIAENHFDGSRNSIVVLGGERRYILSHPDQCELLATYPKEHPSARHSAVDWSRSRFGTLFQSSAPPKRVKLFCKLAKTVVYLPTNWCPLRYFVGPQLPVQYAKWSWTRIHAPPIQQCAYFKKFCK